MNATVEMIDKVSSHPNAERLELATILGYQCVVPIGVYSGGEAVVFIRPDSVLPNKEWAMSFMQYAPKRVKAIKLRNEWSEGIIVDISKLSDYHIPLEIGVCVDDMLEVTHYELPIPNNIHAKSSVLPFGICKTDEERFENMRSKIPFGEICDVTLKVDGQSCSFYYNVNTDEWGVLSRSMELKSLSENKYTHHLKRNFNIDAFIAYCKHNNVSLCLRGESYGLGIQNMSVNPHKLESNKIAFFSTWLIDERRYAERGDRFYYTNVCHELGLETVPLIAEDVIITEDLLNHYSKNITTLDLSKFGLSNNSTFEGVVIKHSKGSFKIINKYYDSKK